MTQTLISNIQNELLKNADERTKATAQNFFKEKVIYHGVKTATVSKIAKQFFPRDKSKAEIFKLCEELFKTGFMEESFVACEWSYKVHKDFEKPDFEIFEKWVKKYITNWATCDTLCNHTVGELIIMIPDLIENLKAWTQSQNRWVKRASAVTLIIPAKKGLFKKEIFEIANILLLDPDDLVQKGYGWVLKSLSQSSIQNQKNVFEFVMKNKQTMPRTALRYAIEKMPSELKSLAMAK